MGLNRIEGTPPLLWETDDFAVELGLEDVGYQIRNRNTQAIETFCENETSAVLTALWLQESYDEVMGDPEKEYERRKALKSSMKGLQTVQ